MTDVVQHEATPSRSWWSDFPVPRWWPDLVGPMDDRMRVEEFEEGDELVVRAEMPGLDPDKDVEITMADHTLRLRAERRESTRSEEKGGYRSEFRYGSFMRTVPLPAGATDKDVKANYTDGILEVRIPIDREAGDSHRIPVAHG